MLFFRLEGERYHLQAPGPDTRFHNPSLGIAFAKDRDVLLRVFDREGHAVPESEEWVMLYQQLQEQMELERRRAEVADRRAEAERERAEALAQEVERLRKLLEAKEPS